MITDVFRHDAHAALPGLRHLRLPLRTPPGRPHRGARRRRPGDHRRRRDVQPVPRGQRPQPGQPAAGPVGRRGPAARVGGRGGGRRRPRDRRPGQPAARPCARQPRLRPRPAAGPRRRRTPRARAARAGPGRVAVDPVDRRTGCASPPAPRWTSVRRRRPGRPTSSRPPSSRSSAGRPWSAWAVTCRSPPRTARPWSVAIAEHPADAHARPECVVELTSGGLATSSTTVRRWRRGGVGPAPPARPPDRAARSRPTGARSRRPGRRAWPPTPPAPPRSCWVRTRSAGSPTAA